jgi:Flp pilus assembly pilin Flp
LLDKVVDSYLTPTAKLIVMEPNEGRELVEYALIAVLVALGVTLILSGVGDQIANIWNAVAGFVLK